LENTFYLGRPWRIHAKTVWIDCYMENLVKPEGWHNWSKTEAESTVFYAEYKTSGPGASNDRVTWSKQLSKSESLKFSVKNVLKGLDNWVPNL